ncbi:MAG: hypothetical protein FH748_08395 [Balneolaceae bacterium]|nr:hypothetical protein [Balneolaceae bacterium]
MQAVFIHEDPDQKTVAFKRSLKGESPMYVLLNRSGSAQSVTIYLPDARQELLNALTGESVELNNQNLTIELPLISGVILR